MKKLKLKLCLGFIILLISTVVVVFCANSLIKNNDFEILGKYSKPICNYDLHEFTSDKCSECKKDIDEVGVFVNRNEYSKDEFKIKFKDRFKSYNQYKLTVDKISRITFILMCSFVIAISSIIFLICEKERG